MGMLRFRQVFRHNTHSGVIIQLGKWRTLSQLVSLHYSAGANAEESEIGCGTTAAGLPAHHVPLKGRRDVIGPIHIHLRRRSQHILKHGVADVGGSRGPAANTTNWEKNAQLQALADRLGKFCGAAPNWRHWPGPVLFRWV